MGTPTGAFRAELISYKAAMATRKAHGLPYQEVIDIAGLNIFKDRLAFETILGLAQARWDTIRDAPTLGEWMDRRRAYEGLLESYGWTDTEMALVLAARQAME